MGLICLGKQKDNESIIDTLVTIETFSKEMKDYLKTMLTSFSYAGSGNSKSTRINANNSKINR